MLKHFLNLILVLSPHLALGTALEPTPVTSAPTSQFMPPPQWEAMPDYPREGLPSAPITNPETPLFVNLETKENLVFSDGSPAFLPRAHIVLVAPQRYKCHPQGADIYRFVFTWIVDPHMGLTLAKGFVNEKHVGFADDIYGFLTTGLDPKLLSGEESLKSAQPTSFQGQANTPETKLPDGTKPTITIRDFIRQSL